MKRFMLFVALYAFSLNAYAAWEALPEQAPAPADNPTTAEKAELGKMLFFDPRFSITGTVSCFSCHNVMEGGDDHRSASIGVHGQVGGRNSPTVWNSAFQSSQFWDGRAATLEEQAKGPVTNPIEMGMASLEDAIERVRAISGYKAYFDDAFGAGDNVTIDNAAKAVAAYERTLITPNSPFDKFVKDDKNVWRVPTLRNLTYTAPYFHNGAVKSLEESVQIMAQAQLNRDLSPEKIADIVAFLESLTGEFPTQTMPRLPPTPGDLLD